MRTILPLLFILIGLGLNAQAPTRIISGNITSNRFLSNDTIYILDGFVFVKNNATLTIEKGTVIKGIKESRSTLIITMGSKIVADGTKAEPIVFTSNEAPGNRAPGDWGGLVVLGRGIINRQSDCSTCPGASVAATLPGFQSAIEGDIDNAEGDGLFGGTIENDNSGILRYVRIEYAGVVITPGNEINSLTLGAVGRGTTIENVMISYANDDAFEWFGGNVDCKNLIAIGSVDDDFDADFGYSGKVQFAIAQRDSFNYDTGTGPTTNGFETDNDGTTNYWNPRTRCVFSNVTIVGPQPTNSPLSVAGNSFNNGVLIRRGSQMSLFNSIIVGFPVGVNLNTTSCVNAFLNDTLFLKNNIIGGSSTTNLTTNIGAQLANVRTKFMSLGNDTLLSAAGLLVDPFNYGNPNFNPAAGSLALSGASFTGPEISNAFFTPTTYRGAIGPNNNWTECWTNFDPQLTEYNRPSNFNPIADFAYTLQGNSLILNNLSVNGTSYTWSLNGGDPQTTFNAAYFITESGSYTIKLITENACGIDSSIQTVNLTVSIADLKENGFVSLNPNPASDLVQINFDLVQSASIQLSVHDINGREVYYSNLGQVQEGLSQYPINTSEWSNGIYFVTIRNEKFTSSIRLFIAK
jgi:PKD repeat protein